ncbi:Uncharacterized domain 1-containing protein [Burkholderiales bacterium 8X]|nr:Uncharacterized domain 1-containing protein [Burkholderiales bacterium 8X]
MAGGNPDQLLLQRFMAAPSVAMLVDTNPVAVDVGMVLVGWNDADQSLALRFRAEPRHVQGNGAVHGGVVSTMLDFALVFAVLARIEAPRVAVTASLNVHFERAVLPGELQGIGRIHRLGGRMAFASADLLDAAGSQVLARATAALAVVG